MVKVVPPVKNCVCMALIGQQSGKNVAKSQTNRGYREYDAPGERHHGYNLTIL